MPIARGPMDVNMQPEPPFLEQDGLSLSHAVVSKSFRGGMTGDSEAHMIAAYTGTPGSAGYVAIEHFAGSVAGRFGAFVMQHSGIMNKGEAKLTVTIVPDSGSGELAGILGTLDIENSDGQHSYVLDYDFN